MVVCANIEMCTLHCMTAAVVVVVVVVADNMSRARLRPTGEDGSEYINASFIDVSVGCIPYCQSPYMYTM